MSKMREISGGPCFTVCVPAYQETLSLLRVIRNIQGSALWNDIGYANREILICVNGGHQPTECVAKALEAENADVRCISIPEKGKVFAIFRLIEESSDQADILFFIDADVVVTLETFSLLKHCLDTESNVSLAGSATVAIEESRRDCGLYQYWYARAFNTSENVGVRTHRGFVPGNCYALRRETALALDGSFPKDPRLGDDKVLNALFNGHARLVPGAAAYFKVPGFLDLVRVRARHITAYKILSRQYPSLYARCAVFKPVTRARFHAFFKLRWWVKIIFFTNYVSHLLGLIFAYRSLTHGVDSWPSVSSSKRYQSPIEGC